MVNPNDDDNCRDEIFDHLTVAMALDPNFRTKAPEDEDLKGISQQLRFTRLISNMETEKSNYLHGVWLWVDNKGEPEYRFFETARITMYMLDQRVKQVSYNQILLDPVNMDTPKSF